MDAHGAGATSGERTDAADDVRRTALQAGVDLVTTGELSTIQFAVGPIRVADVAEELGLSRAAIYKRWPSQQQFRTDLAVHMMATTHEPLLPEMFALERGDLFGSSALDSFRQIERRQIVIQEDHAFRASLLAYTDRDAVRQRCAAVERHHRVEDARRLQRALDDAGRSILAPLTPLDLVTLLRAAADGYVLFARNVPPVMELRAEVGTGRPCSLLAYLAYCLLTELTRPVDRSTHVNDIGSEASAPLDLDVTDGDPRRRQILDVAATMSRNSLRCGTAPQLGAVGHLTLERVARLTGAHRRTLYRCWADHESFRMDVLGSLAAQDRQRYFEAFDRATPAALGDPDRLTMRMVESVTAELYAFDDLAPIPKFALAPYTSHAEVQRQKADNSNEMLEDSLERLDLLLDAMGWSLRHGLTPRHVAAILGVLGLGGDRMHHMDPDAIRRGVPMFGGSWSTIAIAHHAVQRASVDATTPAD